MRVKSFAPTGSSEPASTSPAGSRRAAVLVGRGTAETWNDLSVSSIAEIFPSDQPTARFVVSMSIARNDIQHALLEANRTGREDGPEFSYWVRIATGFMFEASVALQAWRGAEDDVRQLLNRLPASAKDDLKNVMGVVQRVGGGALEHSRQRTFHYPHPDAKHMPDSDQELKDVLEKLRDEEATIQVEGKPPVIRLLFADRVALAMAMGKYEGNKRKLRTQVSEARAAAIAFVRLADAIVASFNDDQGHVFGDPL
jgi:hypothetical protein